MDEKKPKDAATKQDEYLRELARRQERIIKTYPEVLRMSGTSAWTVDAMKELRSQSPEMAAEVNGEIERDFDRLKRAFPMPPLYEIHSGTITSTASVSTANHVVDALESVVGPAPSTTFMTVRNRYQALVEEQDRAGEAYRRVADVMPGYEGMFRSALDSSQVAQVSPEREVGAAMEMRTFLLKMKGELWNLARKWPDENMTWETMASRLTASPERHLLAEQGFSHERLNAWLSDIGKARANNHSLKDIHFRFVDHVYVVCGEVLASRNSGK